MVPMLLPNNGLQEQGAPTLSAPLLANWNQAGVPYLTYCLF
jgi:hypothetical protein